MQPTTEAIGNNTESDIINPDYQWIFKVSLLFDVLVTLYASYHWYYIKNKETNNFKNSKQQYKKDHFQLVVKYSCVYLLATTSDWLQGPYIYALYDVYKFKRKEISLLFCAGYGSGMVFGSFISGMADRCGRRSFVLVYCIVYAISCLTKHVDDFSVLLFGRLLAGIAASLLYSVFEAWFICAHFKAGLAEKYVATSFSIVSYSNYIVAIVAGLVSHVVVLHGNTMRNIDNFYTRGLQGYLLALGWKQPTIYYGGFLNSFDMAFVCLVLCGLLALFLWEENYGSDTTTVDSNYPEPASVLQEKSEENHTNTLSFQFCFQEMKHAFLTTIHNNDILLCGLLSSIFESSMYIFVFNWTPALTDFYNTSHHLPLGLIFSTFMVCCMSGASLFSILIVQYHFKPEIIILCILSISTLCFTILQTKSSSSITITYYSMNIFELCVGIYFPTMATIKSKYVPELQRSAIYSLFRIPLNLFVLVCFLCDWTTIQSFRFVICMLGVAIGFCIMLIKRQWRAWRVVPSRNVV